MNPVQPVMPGLIVPGAQVPGELDLSDGSPSAAVDVLGTSTGVYIVTMSVVGDSGFAMVVFGPDNTLRAPTSTEVCIVTSPAVFGGAPANFQFTLFAALNRWMRAIAPASDCTLYYAARRVQ